MSLWPQGVRKVAVLGAHPDRSRPAFYVPDALFQGGIEILPVNPMFAGQSLWGKMVLSSLHGQQADLVDVFRRSDSLPGHLEEILAMQPLPAWVWFQSGIRNDPVATLLQAKGIQVVQDACAMVEFRRA